MDRVSRRGRGLFKQVGRGRDTRTNRQTQWRGQSDEGFARQPPVNALVSMMMNRNLEQPQSLENEFARVTLDSMAVGVVRTDRFGNLTYLNRMAEKLTGWGREEALAGC